MGNFSLESGTESNLFRRLPMTREFAAKNCRLTCGFEDPRGVVESL